MLSWVYEYMWCVYSLLFICCLYHSNQSISNQACLADHSSYYLKHLVGSPTNAGQCMKDLVCLLTVLVGLWLPRLPGQADRLPARSPKLTYLSCCCNIYGRQVLASLR